MSKFISFIMPSLLLLWPVFGSTSCTVNEDVTSTIVNWLPAYFQNAQQQALIVTTMFSAGQAGGGDIVNSPPFSGFNSTTQQLIWSLTKNAVLSVGIGFPNYEFLFYGWSDTGNVWQFHYNPPLSINRSTYNVNQESGLVVGTAISAETYNCTTRPWYRDAANAQGELVYTAPYGSATSNVLDLTATQALYQNGATKGVVFADLCLFPACLTPSMSESLVVLNSQPAVVAYVMETSTGLLLGNSAGASICLTCYANESSNSYISESAQYIISNKISAPTSQFVQNLGFSVTTKYFENSYGVAVTVVSADFSTTAVSDDDGNSGNSFTETNKLNVLIGLVSTVLAVTVLGLLIQILSFSGTNKSPMSIQTADTELKSIQKA